MVVVERSIPMSELESYFVVGHFRDRVRPTQLELFLVRPVVPDAERLARFLILSA